MEMRIHHNIFLCDRAFANKNENSIVLFSVILMTGQYKDMTGGPKIKHQTFFHKLCVEHST